MWKQRAKYTYLILVVDIVQLQWSVTEERRGSVGGGRGEWREVLCGGRVRHGPVSPVHHIEPHVFLRLQQLQEVGTAPTVDEHNTLHLTEGGGAGDATALGSYLFPSYLVCVAGECSLEVCLPRHRDHGVLDIICLEQRLQDLAGTQRIYIWVGQQQHVL